MQRQINILFLGAAKRVSLMESFVECAKKRNLNIKIFSCEASDDFCPISGLATILPGPKFSDEKFQHWLKENIQKHNINIVVPNMDSATVALAKFNEQNKIDNCLCVVSSYDLCNQMNDKVLSEVFFKKNQIPTYENTDGFFPKIVKDKLGFGGRGQHIVKNKNEYDTLMQSINHENFVIQDYITGVETSTDIFISKSQGLIGYVLRDRLAVSDGEVMDCETRFADENEKTIIEKIANIPGWFGCITLQYIKDDMGNIRIVEINPRFGGGSTCAIACGLDMFDFILSEYFNQKIVLGKIKNLRMTRARRDFYKEI